MTNFDNNINILENIFGIKRIVDAQNKNIINLDNNNLNINDHSCFDFWKTGSECSNCISMRALNENKSFSKYETVDGKVYMIIAAPIVVNKNKYVVELVKDISDDTIASQFNTSLKKELEEEIIRLNELVVTDELTSIYNRRYISEKLPYSINKISKNINTLSIIIIDVNKFKQINDTYGHICGDYVLKELSLIFKTFVNKYNGWVARYGGDEFIMVFENISDKLTKLACKSLKEKIKDHDFTYDNTKIEVSCSLGSTTINNSDIDLDSIISQIDHNLFIDKKLAY